MMPACVLFDLDGTLVDSAPDIADAVNELMGDNGLPSHGLAAVRGMIGHGVEKLVERAFLAKGVSLDADGLARQYARMMEIYARRLTVRTTPMPGARAAVEFFTTRGVRAGVVTNKPEGFSRTILAAYGLDASVAIVIGGDSGFTRKPAPDMLLAACRALGAAPEASLMIGDSAADVASARAAGLRSVVVRGGYTPLAAEELGADQVIDSLEAVSSLFAET